jgi:hypothetical protein
MAKIRVVLFLIILLGTSFAGAEPAATSEKYWDWLGVGPIYSYGPFLLSSLQLYSKHAKLQQLAGVHRFLLVQALAFCSALLLLPTIFYQQVSDKSVVDRHPWGSAKNA